MDPIKLSQEGTSLQFMGDMGSAVSRLIFGIQAKQAADYQAEQLRANAGQEQAAAQREAYLIDLQTKLVNSRALAVAAASGGGASDPTVINLIAQNAAMGAYEKSMALYQGDDRARLLKMQADAREYEGEQTQFNSLVEGAQGAVKAVANEKLGEARTQSLYQRFGGGGPKSG